MRIYDSSVSGSSGQESSRVRESQSSTGSSSAQASGTASSGEDRVDFSNTIGALARAAASDQTSHASRIQALAEQVQNGTYQPNSQAISRGMISEALAGAPSGI